MRACLIKPMEFYQNPLCFGRVLPRQTLRALRRFPGIRLRLLSGGGVLTVPARRGQNGSPHSSAAFVLQP